MVTASWLVTASSLVAKEGQEVEEVVRAPPSERVSRFLVLLQDAGETERGSSTRDRRLLPDCPASLSP